MDHIEPWLILYQLSDVREIIRCMAFPLPPPPHPSKYKSPADDFLYKRFFSCSTCQIEWSYNTFNTKCVCAGRKLNFAGNLYNYEWLYIHYCRACIKHKRIPEHMHLIEHFCESCGNPCRQLYDKR